MAKVQCKMCGGEMQLPEGVCSGSCPYCGTLTTFPKVSSDELENLYNRAEHFRRINEYDKAVSAYEKIVEVNPDDAEAYWGLVISKFGIEYVEDPVSHERIPTCHRVHYESILADADYLNALEKAGSYEKGIYEAEAKRIAEIQRDILSISNNEQPFDVFICYKESDNYGRRTKDSVTAQEIYYQLTNAGYKVFFSRLTLESKLGQQYEPYIFAALNSAKVMLVIGSQKEYFDAVWVRNEWSRFLALMKKDRSKLLIPCYKDMDAYDIPDALSVFQAQDMGKIGFIQDLLHGIKKVVSQSTAPATQAAAPVANSQQLHPFLRRAKLFLRSGDFESAKEYCEKTLDQEPENGWAYFYRLLAENNIKDEIQTIKIANIDQQESFVLAQEFADNSLSAVLNKIINAQIEKEKIRQEEARRRAEEEKIRQEEARRRAEEEKIRQEEKQRRQKEEENRLEKERWKAAKEKQRRQKEDLRLRDEITQRRKRLIRYINAYNSLDKRINIIQQLINSGRCEASLFESDNWLDENTVSPIRIQTEALINSLPPITTLEDMVKKKIKKRNFIIASVIVSILIISALILAAKINHIKQRQAQGYDVCILSTNGETVTGTINKDITICLIPDGVTAIGDSAFYDCSSLTSITIPDNVTTLGNWAFAGCSNLTSVTIPDGVTSIRSGAFANCSRLTDIALPDQVTNLGNNAFAGCSSLTTISIPDGVASIRDSTFMNCSSLTSVTIPDSVTSIGSGAFYGCSSLTSVTIPDSVTSIGSRVFCGCSSLTSVTIPDNVTSLGDSIFEGCSSLTNVTIPDSVTVIGFWAFSDCSSLTSITIPDSVTAIGDWAFMNCSSLTSVTIPDSVTSIGSGAFYGCSSLTSVIIPHNCRISSGTWASFPSTCRVIRR